MIIFIHNVADFTLHYLVDVPTKIPQWKTIHYVNYMSLIQFKKGSTPSSLIRLQFQMRPMSVNMMQFESEQHLMIYSQTETAPVVFNVTHNPLGSLRVIVFYSSAEKH